jgi:hypothetical protein
MPVSFDPRQPCLQGAASNAFIGPSKNSSTTGAYLSRPFTNYSAEQNARPPQLEGPVLSSQQLIQRWKPSNVIPNQFMERGRAYTFALSLLGKALELLIALGVGFFTRKRNPFEMPHEQDPDESRGLDYSHLEIA